MIETALTNFATWLGLSGWQALLFFLLVPVAITVVQHYIEKK